MSKYVQDFKSMHLGMKIFFMLGFPLIAYDVASTVYSLATGNLSYAATRALIAVLWTWFVVTMWRREIQVQNAGL